MNDYNLLSRKYDEAIKYYYPDGFLDVHKLLEEKYHYLFESMNNESCLLNNIPNNFFKEIVFEDKVVGFATYYVDEEENNFALHYIYVLPEYRGNLLFLNEIHANLLKGRNVSIFQVNHRLIDILLENGLAEHITKNLVVTAIELDNVRYNYLCSDKEKKLRDNIYVTNIYDTRLSATIFFDDCDGSIFFSKLLACDIKDYDAKKQRKVSKKYYKKLFNDLLSNTENILKTIRCLNEDLPHVEYDFDEIVGKAPELSIYLEELVQNDTITKERAYEIQDQITAEYEEGYVLNESLLRRLSFLALEEGIDELLDFDTLKCPYCSTPIDYSKSYCPICGFNNKIIFDLEDNLTEFVSTLKDQGFSDEEIHDILSEELGE